MPLFLLWTNKNKKCSHWVKSVGIYNLHCPLNKNTCVELLQEVENHQPRLFMRRRRSTRFLSNWTCFRFLLHSTVHKALSTISHRKSHAKVSPSPQWGQICTWHPLIISTPNKIGQSILGSRPMFATFTLVLKKQLVKELLFTPCKNTNQALTAWATTSRGCERRYDSSVDSYLYSGTLSG